jgi:hypothetical protein
MVKFVAMITLSKLGLIKINNIVSVICEHKDDRLPVTRVVK